MFDNDSIGDDYEIQPSISKIIQLLQEKKSQQDDPLMSLDNVITLLNSCTNESNKKN